MAASRFEIRRVKQPGVGSFAGGRSSGRGSRRASARTVGVASVVLLGCGGLAADGPARSEPTEVPGAGSNARAPEPGETPGREPEGASAASLLDAMLSEMADDLQGIDGQERRFMRYVTVSHVRNGFDARSDRADTAATGVEGAREVRRNAVAKLVNSASNAAEIIRPMRLGPERVFQRIDLRDYGWDRPVAVEGQRYPDGWEAIVAHAAQAVVFEGPAAEHARDLSSSDVPWLLADDFVATVSSGNVYYELMRVPDRLELLERQLADALGDPLLEVYRAGLSLSLASVNPRVVERQGGPESGLWRALDFADAARGQAIFAEPLAIVPDATEVIFTLRNGLRGYFVADATGRRTPVSPLPTSVITDPSQPDGVMRNGASCFSCHNSGLIPFRDEVRERAPSLPPDQQASALALFPEPGVLEALATGDDDRYLRALAAASVSAQSEDPISRVYRAFWDDVGPLQAAGELFVEPPVLGDAAPRLPGGLTALASPSARIPRTGLTSTYIDALCRLHADSENRPSGC